MRCGREPIRRVTSTAPRYAPKVAPSAVSASRPSRRDGSQLPSQFCPPISNQPPDAMQISRYSSMPAGSPDARPM